MSTETYASQAAACDLCHKPFVAGDTLIDGRTQHGPWANMCKDCHEQHGVGLGLGKGQQFTIRAMRSA